MDVDPQDPLLDMRVKAMKLLGLFGDSDAESNRYSFVHFLKLDTFPTKLLDALKVSFMSRKELKALLSTESTTNVDWEKVVNYMSSSSFLAVSKKTEQKAKRELKNMLVSLLEQFSEEMVDEVPNSFKEYIDAQQKILESVVSIVERNKE